MLGYPFTMNSDRAAKMDFSTYQIVTEYALMVPYPEEESKIDSLIRPFEAKVFSKQIPNRKLYHSKLSICELGVVGILNICNCRNSSNELDSTK